MIKLGDPKLYVDEIICALKHPSNEVKRAAFYAGLQLKDKEPFLPLIDSQSVPGRTKIYAARNLLQGESWFALNVALELASHDIEKIRTVACTFLTQFSLHLPFSKPSVELGKSITQQLSDHNSALPQETIKLLTFVTKNYLPQP